MRLQTQRVREARRRLGLTVQYVYVLNDWFRQPGYRDVLEYIRSVDCHYVFGELPLAWLGLPTTAGDVGR